MAKDKGLSTTEFAQYYERKRFEFLGLTQEERDAQRSETPNLTEEMNKLIDVVNSKNNKVIP